MIDQRGEKITAANQSVSKMPTDTVYEGIVT